MQKSIIYSISLGFLLSIFACQGKTTQKDSPQSRTIETETLIDEGYTLIESKEVGPEEIKQMNNSAQSILKHRIQNDTQESWAIIEHGIWEYEFLFENGKMSEVGEYAGHWIDFKADRTYEYGYKNEVKGSGKYHYSPDSGEVLMVNNSNTIKPIQYKLKFAGDIMAFSGSSEYRDNGKQGKLQKVMQRPQ